MYEFYWEKWCKKCTKTGEKNCTICGVKIKLSPVKMSASSFEQVKRLAHGPQNRKIICHLTWHDIKCCTSYFTVLEAVNPDL